MFVCANADENMNRKAVMIRGHFTRHKDKKFGDSLTNK
jgi:hypothetical protein